ncbi:MAG TPA: spiro-SPASM protein [Spirochaetia bacterium]
MKNIAVINGIDLRPPALRPLVDGASAFARALDYARGLPGVQDVVVLLSEQRDVPAGIRSLVRGAWSIGDLLGELAGLAEGFEDLFYFFADCPFLDAGITARMHAQHRRYWADYTFADGYPWGLTPEILTRETVGRLRGMAVPAADAPSRDTLFTVIKKDINSFDIETEIAPTDMRLMRLSLSADTERNFLLLQRVVTAGGRDAQGVCAILDLNREIHRTLPAFYPVQIAERCPQACSYCPWPVARGDVLSLSGLMEPADFDRIAGKIAAFSGDATIDISLWGEPSLHPRVFDIIGAVLSRPGLDLVVETSGIGWEKGLFARVRDSFPRQPRWIVSLDAAREDVYAKLRGPGFAEATRTAEELLALFPTRTWVQAVRMTDNEEDLEIFYRSWKERTENIIIQKHDTFSGTLPDRKVADLSPLTRFPCWHLKRDMPILIDGTVPLCREDVRGTTRLGNALQEDLSAIWERALDTYRAHVAGMYPGICAGCDEYYTFNF